MKRLLVICLLAFRLLPSQAQSGGLFGDQTWDFGEVKFWNNDTAWFTVRNATEKQLLFLPTYYNESFQVMFNSRVAAPGEEIRIGIIYYTEKKGKFYATLPLYVNQKGEPILFHLKGNIKSFDPMALLRCPAVNEGTTPNEVEKVVTVEVRDIETEELIQPDQLSVKSRNGQKVNIEKVGEVYQMAVLPGSYKVNSLKTGYYDYAALVMLEPYQLKYVIYMEKIQEPLELDEPPGPVVEVEPPVTIDTPSVGVEVGADAHIHPPQSSSDSSRRTDMDVVELNAKDYKFNNIIIIVDVSASMNRGGKLEGLKSSFNILVDALRPTDRICIISMASGAAVVQAPVGVYEKDSLKARMARMEAKGSTNGGAAIELAYQLASQNFMAEGNNQIIIATDGVFYGGSLTRQEIEEKIKKGNEGGIHFSALAFGTDPKAKMFLTNLCELGGGSMVQISDPAAAESQLLEMIKTQSKR